MAAQITLAILNALMVGGAIQASDKAKGRYYNTRLLAGITRIVILNMILYWGGWFAPFTR